MKSLLSVAILGALAAAPAFADCTPPDDTVQIPAGDTATLQEMVAAQKAVKAYDTAVKAFGDCLQKDEDAQVLAGADRTKIHTDYAKRNNAEVQKVQQVAAKFNLELQAYRAKNAS